MNNKLTLTTVLSIVILAACSPFSKNPVLTLAPGLVTSDPLATATATPFLPNGSITTDSYSSPTPERFFNRHSSIENIHFGCGSTFSPRGS